MKINRDKLKTALETIKPGLGKNEIMEQATSFAFVNKSIVTYNTEVFIRYPLDDIDFQGAVESEELYKFLSKAKVEEISCVVDENTLMLKAGRAKAGIPIESEIHLPVDEMELEESGWEYLPEDFNQACKFAIMSCSTDMMTPKISCVHINSKGIIEGTDNYRISHWDLGEELPIETTLIPSGSLSKAMGIAPTKIKVEEDWAHFKNEDGVSISCRTFDDTFPNTSSLIGEKPDGMVLNFPDTINEVLDKSQIFLEKQVGGSKKIKISSKGKYITIRSESERGWFKESVKTDNETDEFSFMINPKFLKDILNLSNTCKLSENMNEIEFRGDNWIYLTMLITNE